ncbi:MAG: ABC transporter permease subunit [Candidatus Methanoperedens sp.]|nr:ABC transporter permease subunit [Candidatus Methanoperedens sp.]
MTSQITGFISIVNTETRRLIKGFLPAYFWFTVLVLISTYFVFAEKYVDISIDRSLMTLKYANNPMTEILLYTVSFAVSSVSEVMSGKIPSMVFPFSIGVIFFILFPLMLSLTYMSGHVIKKASTTITGEEEKKTLYIMATSPQTRSSIYLAKFTGLILATLPMIILFYLITELIFSSLFLSVYSTYDAGILVLQILLVNAVLFISAGMLFSALFKNEKKASWTGTKVVTVCSLLTSLWILIPFLEFMMNLTNSNTDILFYLEKLTWISPFTAELMSVYQPSVFIYYLYSLVSASVILFLLGMGIFIKKDLEY